MANNNTGDSASSGGLLVVLGILIAAGVGYFFLSGKDFSGTPGDTNVSVTTPSPETAEPAAGGASSSTTTTTDSNGNSSSTTTTTAPAGQ